MEKKWGHSNDVRIMKKFFENGAIPVTNAASPPAVHAPDPCFFSPPPPTASPSPCRHSLLSPFRRRCRPMARAAVVRWAAPGRRAWARLRRRSSSISASRCRRSALSERSSKSPLTGTRREALVFGTARTMGPSWASSGRRLRDLRRCTFIKFTQLLPASGHAHWITPCKN